MSLPIKPGDMILMKCEGGQIEPTAHQVVELVTRVHQGDHMTISPPCRCGYSLIHVVAPAIVDHIPKEVL